MATIVELIEKKDTRFSICKGAANKQTLGGKHIRYSTYDKILANLADVKSIIQNAADKKPSALQTELNDIAVPYASSFSMALESRGLQDLEASRHDINAPGRLKAMEYTESLVPEKDWNIYYLTSVGYSVDESLQLMVDYYSILPTRKQARHGENDNPRLAKFRDYEKYIALHYEVYWTALSGGKSGSTFVDQIPNADKETAKQLMIKGITTGDESFIIAAENIVNFAIWNGTKHKEAFRSFMIHWLPNARALTRFMKTIEDIINQEMKKHAARVNWDRAVKEISEVDYE